MYIRGSVERERENQGGIARSGCGKPVRRVAAGRCRRCGYDRRATPDRCPECGAVAVGGQECLPRRHQGGEAGDPMRRMSIGDWASGMPPCATWNTCRPTLTTSNGGIRMISVWVWSGLLPGGRGGLHPEHGPVGPGQAERQHQFLARVDVAHADEGRVRPEAGRGVRDDDVVDHALQRVPLVDRPLDDVLADQQAAQRRRFRAARRRPRVLLGHGGGSRLYQPFGRVGDAAIAGTTRGPRPSGARIGGTVVCPRGCAAVQRMKMPGFTANRLPSLRAWSAVMGRRPDRIIDAADAPMSRRRPKSAPVIPLDSAR